MLLNCWRCGSDSWNWSVDIRLDVSWTTWNSDFSDWAFSRNVQTLFHFSLSIISVIWPKINSCWLNEWIFTIVSFWFIMFSQVVVLSFSFSVKVDFSAWHWSWNPVLLCWGFFTRKFLVWGISYLFK